MLHGKIITVEVLGRAKGRSSCRKMGTIRQTSSGRRWSINRTTEMR